MRSTNPGAWWSLAQHVAADKWSRLRVRHARGLWAGHACATITGEGTVMHVAAAGGPGACVCDCVVGLGDFPPPPHNGVEIPPRSRTRPPH